MSYDVDNEKLTAYVLGELDEAERETVEKALEQDETLRQTVTELRATAKLAAEALRNEPAHALTEGQREEITSRVEKAFEAARRQREVPRFRRRLRVAEMVALAVTGLILLSLVLPSYVGRMKRAEDPGMGTFRYDVDFSGNGIYERAKHQLGVAGDAITAGSGGFGAVGARGLGSASVGLRAQVDQGLPTLEATQADRYLIKNATLTIETEDARKAAELLVAAVEELGGYVSDFRESVDQLGRRSVTVAVRVPADKFQTSMERLEPLGKVLSRQVTTEDVTEQFVDTDARLRNLKRTEERLLAHLDRTGELEDIVKVEHELTRVREQVEVLEGRLRFLSHRVDFSTIYITLQEKPKAGPVMPPETYSMAKIASEAARSLVGFFQNLSRCVIWLGIWSVVWVPVLGIVLFLVRRGIGQARKAQE